MNEITITLPLFQWLAFLWVMTGPFIGVVGYYIHWGQKDSKKKVLIWTLAGGPLLWGLLFMVLRILNKKGKIV